MNQILELLLCTTVGSVVSIGGGLLLLTSDKLAMKLSHKMIAFAAGALIAAALYDLLPEALDAHDASVGTVMLWVIAGITLFFFLERYLQWFHHHQHGDDDVHRPKRLLLVTADALHNAIDGVAIAAAVLAGPTIAIVTVVAVAMHEIPHEIGDLAALLKFGMSRRRVVLANLLSAASTVVGGLVAFMLADNIHGAQGPMTGLTVGTLLYLACSDIIPTIHEHDRDHHKIDRASILFLTGVVVVVVAVILAKRIIG